VETTSIYGKQLWIYGVISQGQLTRGDHPAFSLGGGLTTLHRRKLCGLIIWQSGWWSKNMKIGKMDLRETGCDKCVQVRVSVLVVLKFWVLLPQLVYEQYSGWEWNTKTCIEYSFWSFVCAVIWQGCSGSYIGFGTFWKCLKGIVLTMLNTLNHSQQCKTSVWWFKNNLLQLIINVYHITSESTQVSIKINCT
jgi:hypothetical protein